MISSFIEDNVDLKNSDIAPYSSWIRARSRIESCVVKEHVFIGHKSFLKWTRIGKGTQIATSAKILGSKEKAISIGSGVWIGAGVTVLEGVSIGDYAVIGAGAEVTANVDAFDIVVGKPARAVRERCLSYDGLPDFTKFMDQIREKIRRGELAPHVSSRYAQIVGSAHVIAEIFTDGTVTIGEGAVVMGRRSKEGHGGIHGKGNLHIGNNAVIEAAGGLYCGHDVHFQDDCIVVTTGHDLHFESLPQTMEPLRIGSRVLIGEGSILLGGIRIGDDVKILPRSVVNCDVPAGTIAGGIPAKIYKRVD